MVAGRGDPAMPIRLFLKDGHGFDDEAIRVMGLAYECARAGLRISTDDPMTQIIATKVIELARTGERDPEKLCDYAMKGLVPLVDSGGSGRYRVDAP
jgi:hypothetical protein